MQPRILVIRGGAIGDFILTLPAIGLIRQNLPQTRIEILGYPAIARLALDARYADAVHSIEYGPLAGFFSRKPKLDPEMAAFFAGYQQVVSYLYDPDGIFEQNLRTAGVKNLLCGPGKLADEAHAVEQLARPLEQLAFFLEDNAAKFTPHEQDLAAARPALELFPEKFIAVHPGSGGQRKNWPLDRWKKLIAHLQEQKHAVLLVGGEADQTILRELQSHFHLPAAENLPLRTLGAILSRARLFLGHDSGISHLAAAAGVPCLLLFGPTDPDIWAPLNPAVEVLASPDQTMAGISCETVLARAASLLG